MIANEILSLPLSQVFRNDEIFSGYFWVPPLSVVYNFIIERDDKIVGFDSMRRRKRPLNEGFTGNPGDSDPMF
jgi:hypothetical protein